MSSLSLVDRPCVHRPMLRRRLWTKTLAIRLWIASWSTWKTSPSLRTAIFSWWKATVKRYAGCGSWIRRGDYATMPGRSARAHQPAPHHARALPTRGRPPSGCRPLSRWPRMVRFMWPTRRWRASTRPWVLSRMSTDMEKWRSSTPLHARCS